MADQLQILLDAIVADPGDDAAWFALADCLEEQDRSGEAELTRLREWLRRADLDDLERSARETRLQELIAEGVRPVMPRLLVPLGEDVNLEMVLIPPGSFWMGSPDHENDRFNDEGPRHRVMITRGYWLGVAPITRRQWQAVLGNLPGEFADVEGPAEMVSWTDCQKLCSTLRKRTGRAFDLPTEAQWEHACRAGTTSPYYTGTTLTALAQAAWYRANSNSRTQRVGQKLPNAWGVFDMLGNVWEWCQDGFRRYGVKARIDPVGRATNARILRGGCWHQYPRCCRAASRSHFAASSMDESVGCRVCIPLGAPL